MHQQALRQSGSSVESYHHFENSNTANYDQSCNRMALIAELFLGNRIHLHDSVQSFY